ncbi:MAG: ATP-binding protein [Acidimicrobiales bacterium]
MTRRLLLSYLAITVIVLIMLEIPLAVFYSQREEERFIADAERDAVVLASFYEGVLELGSQPDTTLAGDYAERTSARIVLVDTDGISVLDTGADADRDFSTRPEIQTALTGRRDAGIRRSETLDTDILFVAVPVASGGTVHGALRLTIDASEVTKRIQRFWIALGAVAAIVLLAVTGIGWAIARSVTKPIRELQASARRFAEGDLSTAGLDGDAPPEIAALGDTMNMMAVRLEQLINAQRAFVGDASHQLRTPLTALRLRLENLETRLADDIDIDEATAAIDEIERLATLVDDLLQLARVDQQPPTEALDITPVVTDRIDTWSAVAAEHDVGLEFHSPQRPVWVTAIPGAVEQLLDNTIDNAVKHSPANSTVEIHLLPGHGTTRLIVRDHGPGLGDDDKHRALQRFWRGDTTTAGSGLGLAIATSLAEAGGGALELEDTRGGGLTVVVELPTEPARPAGKT